MKPPSLWKLASLIILLLLLRRLSVTASISVCHQPQDENDKPKAFIHIGPHKTGSTYFQNYLHSHRTALQKLGFINIHAEATDYLKIKDPAKLSRRRHHVRDMVQNISSTGHAVIYSAEGLCAITPLAVEQLRKDFDRYAVTIIVIYREPLTRHMSAHNHLVRRFDTNRTLIETLDDFLHRQAKLTDYIISKFTPLFGQENVIALDYEGMRAAGKDIAHVLLCEVMCVPCHSHSGNQVDSILKPGFPIAIKSHELRGALPSANWTAVQLLEPILQYAEKHFSCTRNVHSHLAPIAAGVVHELLEKTTGEMIPLRSVSLDAMKALAESIDMSFRALHGHRLLYSNKTANAIVRESVRYDEVDVQQLPRRDYWIQWLRNAASAIFKKGWLRGCVGLS